MGYSGEIKGVNLPDLIQMACLEGRDRIMIVRAKQQEGRIFFSKGEIVHAETPRKNGIDAFFDIMAWPSGFFELRHGRTDKRSIDMPWNCLLIESQRQIDERKGDVSGDEEASPPALKILLVDDSRVAINALKRAIHKLCPEHSILEARNGKEALEEIRNERPDFVCLDASMPVMDGDVTLMHIMVRSPAPVALVSGLDKSKTEEIMDFFRLGAVDFLPKPGPEGDWEEVEARLSFLLKVVPELKIHQVRRARKPHISQVKIASEVEANSLVVVLGGLGGILELQKLIGSKSIQRLDRVAFIVIQDMTKFLIPSVCAYVDKYSPLKSKIPSNGQKICAGEIYINNWDFPWEIAEGSFRKGLSANEKIEQVKYFLTSCARHFGPRLVTLVLTGTDPRVADGLKEVVSTGGHLLLQSPKTCLHPKTIIALEALELEEGYFDTEGFQRVIDRFFPVDGDEQWKNTVVKI